MTDNIASVEKPCGNHMSLEEFCGTIRHMEAQGKDGISMFNEVISKGLAPDFIAEDEVQHSRRLERITTEITC